MSWIGKPLTRVEDERLLKGEGRFLADIRQPGTLEAVFVRSSHAHANIRSIDTSAATAASGVVAVITQKDIAGRTAPICVAGEVHTPEKLLRELKPLDRVHPTPLFPEKKATYVGQPVALVIAETLAQALDAAERVEIDYEPLPSVVDPIAALKDGAPLVEPEFGSNLVLSVGIRKGDPDAVKFPRSLLGRDSLDFSFSGLKTAVLYHVRGVPGKKDRHPIALTDQTLRDIAASLAEGGTCSFTVLSPCGGISRMEPFQISPRKWFSCGNAKSQTSSAT